VKSHELPGLMQCLSARPFSIESSELLRLPSGISARPSNIPGPSGTSDEPASFVQCSNPVPDLDNFTSPIHDATPQILSNAININPEYVDLYEGEHVELHEAEYIHEDDFPDEDFFLDDGEPGDEAITLEPPASTVSLIPFRILLILS
jgi:hypothetical protein